MKKFLRKIFTIILLATVVFMGYIMTTLPSLQAFSYTPTSKSVILSSDGEVLGEITSRNSTYIPSEEIPDMLKKAVVAVEDKRFYKHFGVDPIGIARALYNNYKAGEIVEGGSTITQQVAKNLFFSTKQSYIRKLREAITAIKMEIKMDKDEILTIYLNEIYLGDGAYGVYEASMAYFDRAPMNLSLSECAMLAGIIQAPSAYCPLDDEGYELAMQRKDKVLDLMYAQGFITEEERDEAKSQKIKITPDNESSFSYGVCIEGCESYLNRVYENCIETISAHYVDKLNYSTEAAEAEAARLLMTENLTIHATMNYDMQMNALDAMEMTLEDKDKDADCAFVAVDTNNGNILAYYGSDTYIDMANTPRQPGSTIKPLYMAYLIENGIADRNTIVNDERFDINGYSPGNFASRYYGYVTMRETLTESLNAASLRFFLMADTNDIINYVKTLGISTVDDGDYNAAFALGGMVNGIKPREMALTYASIVNGGKLYKSSYINSIISEAGVILYPENKKPEKVMSMNTSEQLKSCLESVVLRGTATKADPGYATIGKTGTTDNEKDVWFAGATANVSMAIWIGNVDYLNVNNLASSWCSNIYRDTLKESIKDGAIDKSYLSEKRTEEVCEIIILKNAFPENGVSADKFSEDNLIALKVPSYEIENFEDKQVVKVKVDSLSGKLYVEGKCNPMLMVEKYFLKSEAPTKECDILHISDIRDSINDLFNF